MRPFLPLIITTFLLLAAAPASAAPSATIGMVDCAAGGGVTVTLQNDSGGPVRFVLQRGDEVVATHVQPPGPAATRVVPIPDGTPSQVTIRYGGSWTSAMVMRSCDAASATQARAPATAADAPYVAAPLVAATAEAAPSRAVPATSAAAQPSDVALPEEPRGQAGWLVALAALLLAAIVAIAPRWRRHGRRATTPAARPPA